MLNVVTEIRVTVIASRSPHVGLGPLQSNTHRSDDLKMENGKCTPSATLLTFITFQI